MCDTPTNAPICTWQGWCEIPEHKSRSATGEWIDLTYPLSARVPRSAMFEPPTFSRIAEMPGSPANISRMDMVVHTGTHVDAPVHFCAEAPGMDEVPIERLMGQGVVVRIDAEPCYAITARDLSDAAPQIEPGDILAIETGWTTRWETSDWTRHPYLAEDAANWLLEQQVKMIAVDTINPDLPFDLRPADFDFPVHRALLQRGVLIAEQLANLEALVSHRVEFFFGPLPIKGCDGSPARVLGRTVA